MCLVWDGSNMIINILLHKNIFARRVTFFFVNFFEVRFKGKSISRKKPQLKIKIIFNKRKGLKLLKKQNKKLLNKINRTQVFLCKSETVQNLFRAKMTLHAKLSNRAFVTPTNLEQQLYIFRVKTKNLSAHFKTKKMFKGFREQCHITCYKKIKYKTGFIYFQHQITPINLVQLLKYIQN